MITLKDRYKSKVKSVARVAKGLGKAAKDVFKAGSMVLTEPFTDRRLKGAFGSLESEANKKDMAAKEEKDRMKLRYKMPEKAIKNYK